MRRYAILAGLMVAGCGAPGSVGAPDMVQLGGGQLTVRTTDGLICRAPVHGPARGSFPDCPRRLTYQVDLRHPNLLEDTGLVEPFADIALTDEAGRVTRFKTPGSREWQLGPVRE